MDTLLPSQPENYWKLIKRSLVIYRVSFFHVFLLALVLSAVAFIPRIVSLYAGYNFFQNLAATSPHKLWILLINLICLLLFIALIWRIRCVIHNKHEPFIEDLSVGIRKTLYVFVAAIIQGLVLLGVMLIIYGMLHLLRHQQPNINSAASFIIAYIVLVGQLFLLTYVFTLFYFYVPLIAIENRGIIGSLERSIYLVWNHWWRTFSVQVTPWLTYLIVLIIIRFFFHINIHIYLIEGTQPNALVTILHIFLFALFIPWDAAILLVQLKDLELRKNIASKL